MTIAAEKRAPRLDGARAKALGRRFEASLAPAERHARGAYYTRAAEIRRAIDPVLGRPLRARIAAAETLADLAAAHEAIAGVRVLDPACGAGDFLRIALAELGAIEREAIAAIVAQGGVAPAPRVGPHQLSGIDVDPGAIAIARAVLGPDAHLICDDALFCAWPAADVIVMNPPFMAKNKAQAELGAAYARRVRARFPGVPGRADLAVYWIRRAHDELPAGGRAAIVATNTIRQNDSRRGGLDHVVENGGTIIEAVSTAVWPGDAAVHVSIACWVKGAHAGKKRLLTQLGDRADAPWRVEIVDRIPPSLSAAIDVASARPLRENREPRVCFQGQTPGHDAFLIEAEEARAILARSPESAAVLFPFLTGEDLVARGEPSRFVIDFGERVLDEARRFIELFARIEARVRPAREEAARREEEREASAPGRGNRHHRAFFARFWQLGYRRGEMLAKLATLPRYIAASRIGKRPIFAFVDARVRPSDALVVFALDTDHAFGVLQSSAHAAWLYARCSTLKADARYTSSTVFDSFPWPDGAPQIVGAPTISEAARRVLAERRRLAGRAGGLRAMYAAMERGEAPDLAAAHAELDAAVRAAYGVREGDDMLAALLARNEELARREA
jgi:SAM-dependent methyltransferase